MHCHPAVRWSALSQYWGWLEATERLRFAYESLKVSVREVSGANNLDRNCAAKRYVKRCFVYNTHAAHTEFGKTSV